MSQNDDARLTVVTIGTGITFFAGLIAVIAGVMDLVFLGLGGIWMLLLGLGFWAVVWFLFAPALRNLMQEGDP